MTSKFKTGSFLNTTINIHYYFYIAEKNTSTSCTYGNMLIQKLYPLPQMTECSNTDYCSSDRLSVLNLGDQIRPCKVL